MRAQHILVAVFFFSLFALGTSIFSDFGISWDESMNRRQGMLTVEYVTNGDTRALRNPMRYHGMAFELILQILEKGLGLTDKRTIFLMRHFATFAVAFLGVFVFYRLCTEVFDSWRIGLAGAFFLVVSPRIFSHSFYNLKDIPCMSFFIIGVYTMISFLDTREKKWVVGHALACALLISMRVTGVLIPALTALAVGWEGWRARSNQKEIRQIALLFAAYIVLVSSLTALFWPALWRNPPLHLMKAIQLMSRYTWEGYVLYLGEYWRGTEMPWHYLPLWILISTPVSYIVRFAVGLMVSLKRISSGADGELPSRRNIFLLLLWLIIPLVAVISLRSVVYDGWRHMYFVYPGLLAVALVGFRWLLKRLDTGPMAFKAALMLLLAADMGGTAYFMIRNHPHQNVYFNHFIGGIRGAHGRFELDYWGVSYRAALEYLVGHVGDEEIKVNVANRPGLLNWNILSQEDQKRVRLVGDSREADYFITNFRSRKAVPFDNQVYAVLVDGVPIAAVFER